MNMYRRLGDQIATTEARELAEQLVSWHDAMVKHIRVLSARHDAECGEDCPHEEAASLWTAAQRTFGARARDLTFLRSNGQQRRLRTETDTHVRDRAVEMRV
jgi:hypothetical protein